MEKPLKKDRADLPEAGECGSSSHNHMRLENVHLSDRQDTTGPRLLITLGINLLIPLAQVVSGIYAHSMALISDAAHNFSDFTAILIAYFAYLIGRKGASATSSASGFPEFIQPLKG